MDAIKARRFVITHGAVELLVGGVIALVIVKYAFPLAYEGAKILASL